MGRFGSPPIHASTHEDGGRDEIDLSGLVGVATKQVSIRWANRGSGDGSLNWGSYGKARDLNDADDMTAFVFIVPHDFTEIVEAVLYVKSDTTKTTADIDLASEYGKEGEANDANTESDTTTTHSLVADVLSLLDISSVLTGIEAGDLVWVGVTNKENFDVEIPEQNSGYMRYS